MDRPAENLSPNAPRPRDLALLLLAIGFDPPRARARDQEADRAGGLLRQRMLDDIAARDPEPDELEAMLASLVTELGEPSGPSRGVAVFIRDEWEQAQQNPDYWSWLVSEALQVTARDGSPRRRERRSRGAP